MTGAGHPTPVSARRWLKEPMLHFLLIGALLFFLHRVFVGDARNIVLTAAIKANVARRFADQYGREPSVLELAKALRDWRQEEAFYREALRDGLDRDDATIRTVLADKVRARAVQEAPQRQPTQAELEQWLRDHQSGYEVPLRYEYELVTFAKTKAAERELESYQQALAAGKDPRELGRPIAGGSLSAEDLAQKFGAELAAPASAQAPSGAWRRLDGREQWLLARITRVQGGLPTVDELRPRLIADWSRAQEQQAVDRAVQQIVARYRFQERP